MSFKLKPPYNIDSTPIYRTLEEDGVLGVANKNGSIRINKNLNNPIQIQEIIDHEKVHVDQIRRGDLDYDDDYMYWKGEKIKRSENMDGNPALTHEKEADNKAIQKRVKRKSNGKI
tara:strand:+ start:33 stop:380 length:348 start_codon:yes stop_codon:yes gene_type:complete